MPEKTKDFEKSTKIYLDHNATTPVSEEILSGLNLIARIWGNPSSIHWSGRGPKSLIRESRSALADLLGKVSPLELIFTSGGSESNSCVIKGAFDLHKQAPPGSDLFSRNEFITTSVEHPSVLKSFEWIQKRGGIVHYLRVNRQGEIDLDQYKAVLNKRTALVSVMLANNETGVIFPIQKMAELAHELGGFFHTDAVQALGKIDFDLRKLNVDYASFSAHKIYSLKGTGLLYVKKASPLEPLISGGGQERHRRGGTENTIGIWGMGLMAQRFLTPGFEVRTLFPKLEYLRNYFEQQVIGLLSEVSITAGGAKRLPNTSSLVIAGVDGEVLLMSLDLLGFAVSTGAACSSGSPEPSPTLLSMGLSRSEAQSSLRVSIGVDTTLEQIDFFIKALVDTVTRLRRIQGSGVEAGQKESLFNV